MWLQYLWRSEEGIVSPGATAAWLCAAQDGCLENADHHSGTSVGKVSPARMTRKGKGQCRSRGDVFPKILGRKEQGQRSVEGLFCKAWRTGSHPFGAEKASLSGALLAFRWMEHDRCLLLSVLMPRQTSWGLMQALPHSFPCLELL